MNTTDEIRWKQPGQGSRDAGGSRRQFSVLQAKKQKNETMGLLHTFPSVKLPVNKSAMDEKRYPLEQRFVAMK